MSSISPGCECPTCGRKVPEVHDKPPGQKQTRFTVAEPIGESGLLDELLIQLVEIYKPHWPDDLGDIGDRGWRYRALSYGLHSLVNAPPDVMARLLPSETGG